MCEAITTTAPGLRGGGQPGWAAPAGPYLASQYVKERTALIWGVANRSMLRDEAKCFLDAGALIEISDMVLRVSRLAADLDFQRRALPDGARLTGICKQTQQELAHIDHDVAERYFAGA